MKKLKKLLDKNLIVKYISVSFVKTFLISLAVSGAALLVLTLAGLYTRLESILNLKFNSPFILVPLFAFAALAVLCFFIGFLLYFYKYKRSKSKSAFGSALSNILDKK